MIAKTVTIQRLIEKVFDGNTVKAKAGSSISLIKFEKRTFLTPFLLRKSMDWSLYDNGLRHESVKCACKGVRNVRFLENFACVLNK